MVGTLAAAGLALAGCGTAQLSSAASPTPFSGGTPASLSSISATAVPPGRLRTNNSTAPTTPDEKMAMRAISATSPAVVKVTNVGVGLGSGVVLTSNGYVVTNNHVVKGGKRFKVTLASGATYPARVVGTDSADDLAVVKVAAAHLPVATFANSSRLQVGQTVLAIGNPLGEGETVTEGLVSGLDRNVEESTSGPLIRNAIQTSALINPGNSGGALIDLSAHVVGIPTLGAIDPEFNAPAPGIGYAIPSNTVISIANQIIKYGKVLHTGRAALGIQAASVTAMIAQQYNLPVTHGVAIVSVLKGGAAASAGLKSGDIIVRVDQHAVSGNSALLDYLVQKKPGDTVLVTVLAPPKWKRQTIKVTLGEYPANANG